MLGFDFLFLEERELLLITTCNIFMYNEFHMFCHITKHLGHWRSSVTSYSSSIFKLRWIERTYVKTVKRTCPDKRSYLSELIRNLVEVISD